MPFGLDLVSYGYTALQDATGKLYVHQFVHKTSCLLGMPKNQMKNDEFCMVHVDIFNESWN